MENGWIKLHRTILDSPLISKPNYFLLWVTLLLRANHKKIKMIWNNEIIVIHEGQVLTGRNELSKLTQIPETTIEDILNFLEKEGNIRQQKTTKYRVITILNWKTYQNSDNKATTKRQQSDTNKNDKNDKNDKNIPSEPSSQGIPLIIKAFEKINPACKNFYGNKNQRKACQNLIDDYGLERIINIIEKTLPKTNGMEFFPTITSPTELRDRFVKLESAIRKYKNKSQSIKNTIAF